MTPAKLAAALVKAQAELPAVKPNATNPHFKSEFVTLDHLIALTRPVLNLHGLAIVQLPSIGPAGEPALTTTIVHESGESIEQQMLLLAVKVDPQGQGAALTYARRYAWAAALGISAEVDDDGNTASKKPVRKPVGQPVRDSPPSLDVPGEEDLPDALKSDPTLPISKEQRDRLWAIATGKQMPEESVREVVRELTGQDSTRKIQRSEYQAVSDLVEAWVPPESELAGKATRIQLTTLFREKGFTTAEQRKAYARQLLRKGEDFDSSQLTQTEAQFLITFLEAHNPPA